jgi:glucose/mannose-6-phosphate isomerase
LKTKDNTSLGSKNMVDLMRWVFIGMGGSGIGGDVLSCYLQNIGIEAYSFHTQEIPKTYLNNSHFVVTSYSGNTKETITAFKQIKKKPHTLVTSGGYLLNYAVENRDRFIPLPKGYVPRDAFYIILKAIYGLVSEFAELPEFPEIKNPDQINIKKMADALKKSPLIYSSSEKIYPAAYRLKTQVNENLKKHAFSNYFNELSHNEIEAKNQKDYSHIILNAGDNDEFVEAWKKAVGVKAYDFQLKGRTVFDKMLYAIMLGDQATIKLADELKINRIPTPFIKKFKDALN